MAFKKIKAPENQNLNLTSMIDITSFILLALAILSMSMKKEASLDNIIRLPGLDNAKKQDTTELQIYVLPARILDGGLIDPDSTGLVAFTDKSNAPDSCDSCGLPFRDANKIYMPNSLLDFSRKPLASMKSDIETKSKEEQEKLEQLIKLERPPAYYCSRCGKEISPYLKLDEIPVELKKKKKKILEDMVKGANFSRTQEGKPPLNEAEIKKIEEEIPLMIKADDKAFYGRILQVVNTVKDTSCNIRKFAFVSSSEAAALAQKKREQAQK